MRVLLKWCLGDPLMYHVKGSVSYIQLLLKSPKACANVQAYHQEYQQRRTQSLGRHSPGVSPYLLHLNGDRRMLLFTTCQLVLLSPPPPILSRPQKALPMTGWLQASYRMHCTDTCVLSQTCRCSDTQMLVNTRTQVISMLGNYKC